MAAGVTRLFRVEPVRSGREVPEWIARRRDELGISEAEGRWFVSDAALLEWYREDATGPTRTAYVDIPNGDLERYRVSNSRERIGSRPVMSYSRDPENEFFLPKELAAMRKELSGAGAEIRVLPGEGNALTWREDRSFDIHDRTGKVGYIAGYAWGDDEFRITHVEIAAAGRSLSPGEWKGVLRGLGEQLPGVDVASGNRGGEGGELHPASEKFVRLPAADEPDGPPTHPGGSIDGSPDDGAVHRVSGEEVEQATKAADAFDHAVSGLRQDWWDDGLGYGLGPGRDSWPEVPGEEKITHLAHIAAAHEVSFERFTSAARPMLNLPTGQAFGADEERHLRREFDQAAERQAQFRADLESLIAELPDGTPEPAGRQQGAAVSVGASPPAGDLFYVMATQNPEEGRTWTFVAGPYDSEAMADDNRDFAVREYAARNNQPGWFQDAQINIVRSDMRLPTALGPVRQPEMEDLTTPAELQKIAAEIRHDEGLRVMEDRGVKYEDAYERVLDGRDLVARYDPEAGMRGGRKAFDKDRGR